MCAVLVCVHEVVRARDRVRVREEEEEEEGERGC